MHLAAWVCGFLASAVMAGTGHAFNAVAAQTNIGGTAQQTLRSPNLWFTTRVARSDGLDDARSSRLYEEPSQIVLVLTIGHDALEMATADQESFASQLRITVKGEDVEPIEIEMEGSFRRVVGLLKREELHPTEPLQIASRDAIEWELTLQRVDRQRFTTGRYTIDLSLAGPFSTLRLDDGTTPRSRSSEATLTIGLGPPINAREQGRMHGLAAQTAIQRSVEVVQTCAAGPWRRLCAGYRGRQRVH